MTISKREYVKNDLLHIQLNIERKLPNLCLGRRTDDPLDNIVSPAYQRTRYRMIVYKQTAPSMYQQDLNNLVNVIRQIDEHAENVFRKKKPF